MKKSTLLNLALSLVAIFIFAGAQAQTNTGQWAANGTINEYTNAAGNTVTFGKAMPFWVWPSAAYNPNFNFAIGAYATPATITTNVSSAFDWTATTGGATIVPFQTGLPLTNRNYATISWPYGSIGAQTVSVLETPASGVCPATAVTYAVTVIDTPKVAITTVAAKFGLTKLIQSNCWALANDNTSQIGFAVNTAAEVYPYAFYLDYKTYNVDGLDVSGNVPLTGGNLNTTGATVIGTPSAAGVTLLAYDNKLTGVGGGVPTKTGNPISVAAGTNLLAVAADFPALNSKITVYELDFSGYNAKVSRTSDYLAKSITTNAIRDNWGTYTQYGKSALKYYIVALPKPVTGPIYHISNSFGL